MGIFNRKKIEQRSDLIVPNSENVLVSAFLNNDLIDKEKALNIPSVKSSIKFIAETVSTIPIKLYSEKNGLIQEVKNDNRLRLLNDETGDTLDAVQFWKAILTDYFLGKGGYAYIKKRGTNFESLHYVDELQVSVLKNSDPIFKDIKYQINGKQYEQFDLLKFLRNSKDGASGISVVTENQLILSVAYNTLQFQEQLVKKGGNKKGFLISTKKLAQEVIDKLKESFKNLYSNNTESVVVLNDGLQFQESSNTSVEMQTNENRETNSKEIFELFNLSQDFIRGKVSAKEYSSTFKIAITPILRMIECSINRDLLLEREKSGEEVKFFAFDTREILKGDMKERYEAYKLAIESGLKNIDEVRYMENDPAFGIDWINISLNSVLYNLKTGDIYTPNTNITNNVNNTNNNPDPKNTTKVV